MCGVTPRARAAWLALPSTDGCSSARVELHALGPELAEVYDQSTSCGAAPSGSAYQRVFGVGAVLDPSTLPVIEHEDQGAAVKARALSVAGRLVGPATHFSLGAARCDLAQFPDGSTRCISPTRDAQVSPEGAAYADAACTQPLYPASWATACNGAAPDHILIAEGGRCGTRVLSVLAVGARYTGTSLYWKGGGPAPCNPLPNLGTAYYEAGGSVSPEVFERITELVE